MWLELAIWLRDNSTAILLSTFILTGAFGVWVWGWQHRYVLTALDESRMETQQWRAVALGLMGDISDRALTQGRDLPSTRSLLTAIRLALTDLFDESELQNIFFDLGIDYDTVAGETKTDKARGLVQHMDHLKRLPDLVTQLDRYRPEWRSKD